MATHPLDAIPLWLFFLIICIVIAAPLEVGRRLGRQYKQVASGERDTSVGVMVGAVLGLLAFLLAFTFGMAASRFEDRRQIVLREANAISTTWLRCEFLAEPHAPRAAALLHDYVDVRVRAAHAHVTKDELADAIQRSEQIHRELWDIAVAATDESPTPVTSLFVQSLNDVIDLHAARIFAGVESRIPLTIWVGLLSVSVLALGSAAFQSGMTSKRRPVVIFGLLLAFGGVLTMIADLDRPNQGFLQTTQSPMLALQRSMAD